MPGTPVTLTVYPDQCDTFGHLNQAAFLSLFERARWEMMAGGPGLDFFTRHDAWPAVRKATIEYHTSAFPGDVLRFHQALTRLGRTSFTMRQVARQSRDETLVASAEFVFVCIDAEGRPVPVPAALGELLSPPPHVDGELRRMEVHGVELAFDDRGGGPAILFIHGYPFDHSIWRHQMAELEGFRRIAPDLRGLGRSDAPDLGYSMATYVEDLAALLDALGVDSVVLCGLSMGGYIAFEFLRRYRQRVRGVVFAATRAQADSAEGRKARELAIQEAREGGAALIAERMLPRLLAAAASADLREEVRAMMSAAPVPGIIGALAAMRDRPDSTSLLQELAGVPTLVVVGEEDRLAPVADAELIAKGIPGARLAIVKAAGHLVPLERPAEVNQLIKHFLDSL
jgi:YbgC/YbaW family acyl-CoA thioester hydrolase